MDTTAVIDIKPLADHALMLSSQESQHSFVSKQAGLYDEFSGNIVVDPLLYGKSPVGAQA